MGRLSGLIDHLALNEQKNEARRAELRTRCAPAVEVTMNAEFQLDEFALRELITT